MSYVKGIIILAVLALSAISQQVAYGETLREVCSRLKFTLNDKIWNQSERYIIGGAKLLRFLTGSKSSKDALGNVIRAMEAFYRREECSDESLDYLDNMTECFDVKIRFEVYIKDYKKNCLRPELMNPMIKSVVKGNTVDILSADSIKRNENIRAWLYDPIMTLLLGMERSLVMNAIYEGFKTKRQKSGGKKPSSLLNYLDKVLFKPCARYIESVGPFMWKLFKASELNKMFEEGTSEAGLTFSSLVQALDEEAKYAVFRYVYCDSVIREQKAVFEHLEDRMKHPESPMV